MMIPDSFQNTLPNENYKGRVNMLKESVVFERNLGLLPWLGRSSVRDDVPLIDGAITDAKEIRGYLYLGNGDVTPSYRLWRHTKMCSCITMSRFVFRNETAPVECIRTCSITAAVLLHFEPCYSRNKQFYSRQWKILNLFY